MTSNYNKPAKNPTTPDCMKYSNKCCLHLAGLVQTSDIVLDQGRELCLWTNVWPLDSHDGNSAAGLFSATMCEVVAYLEFKKESKFNDNKHLNVTGSSSILTQWYRI